MGKRKSIDTIRTVSLQTNFMSLPRRRIVLVQLPILPSLRIPAVTWA
jgi:hypothetical protein